MTILKSYPASSHFLAAILMLALPWAAAAQTIDDARTSSVSNSINDATINNDGTISTEGGGFAHGIASTGDDAEITNNGEVTTTGDFASAILSEYAIKDRVDLDGAIEYARTSGDSSGALSGRLGLVFDF